MSAQSIEIWPISSERRTNSVRTQITVVVVVIVSAVDCMEAPNTTETVKTKTKRTKRNAACRLRAAQFRSVVSIYLLIVQCITMLLMLVIIILELMLMALNEFIYMTIYRAFYAYKINAFF